MFRWLVICTLLAAGTVTIMYVVTQTLQNPPVAGAGEKPSSTNSDSTQSQPRPTASTEERGTVNPLALITLGNGQKSAAQDRIVIPNGRVYMIDRQDVPSERDGKLICIATERAPGEPMPPKEKQVSVSFAFLAIELEKNEKTTEQTFPLGEKDKLYRRWQPLKDPLTPEKIMVAKETHILRKLQVGDMVQEGQLLALVNPALAIDELTSKVAKLDASEADVKVAIKTKEEAGKRYDSAVVAYRGKAISEDDFRAAKLAWDRYIEEEFAKRAAVRQSQAEVRAAITGLKMHEVRAAVSGQVKQIYKNSLGEAVKNLESILSIQSPKHLRVEASVEVQVARALKKGMPAFIEAANPVPPSAELKDHQQAVTCVAVSKGPSPKIVSGSEDRSIRVWSQKDGNWKQQAELKHNAVVRAVTCTGPAAAQDLALIGAWDGSVHLLDLEEKLTRPMAVRHSKPVNCVAFSPDGTMCASGDDDNSIYLWNTDDGQLITKIPGAHRARVTSLQFASADLLVSAGQDLRLVAWDIKDPKNPRLSREIVDRRNGTVTKLGVSPDGKYVLADHGKELRRMSLETGRIDGVIANYNEAQTFSDMALFSPDGLTVLTNGPKDGQLQLWRTPTADSRADELRQFIWTQGVATCGAFAPDSSFVVTGTKDNKVLVWTMPPTEDNNGQRVLKEKPLQAALTLVDESLDSTTRLVRVWAEFVNPEGRLTPGSTATIVIPTK